MYYYLDTTGKLDIKNKLDTKIELDEIQSGYQNQIGCNHNMFATNNFSEQKYNSFQFCDNYSQRMLLKKLKNWSSRLTGKSWKLDLFYSCWYKDSNNEPFVQKELHEYFLSSERASL